MYLRKEYNIDLLSTQITRISSIINITINNHTA